MENKEKSKEHFFKALAWKPNNPRYIEDAKFYKDPAQSKISVIIPFFVFYLTLQIMMKRPGGYGETSLLEKNPYYYQYKSNKPYFIAGLIAFLFLFLGSHDGTAASSIRV